MPPLKTQWAVPPGTSVKLAPRSSDAARRRAEGIDARAAACRAVRRGVIDAAVAGDGRAVGVSLADVDRRVAGLVVVVRAAGEDPVGRTAGDVGEFGAEVE